jgi:hypothetical protein
MSETTLRVPRERRAAFAPVARETVTGRVVIVHTGSRVVRRQWRRGVAAAGGDPTRLVFVSAAELAGRGGKA